MKPSLRPRQEAPKAYYLDISLDDFDPPIVYVDQAAWSTPNPSAEPARFNQTGDDGWSQGTYHSTVVEGADLAFNFSGQSLRSHGPGSDSRELPASLAAGCCLVVRFSIGPGLTRNVVRLTRRHPLFVQAARSKSTAPRPAPTQRSMFRSPRSPPVSPSPLRQTRACPLACSLPPLA